MGMDNQLTQLEYAEKIGVSWPAAKSRLYTRKMSTGKHDIATVESMAVLNEIKTGKKTTVKTAKTKPAVFKPDVKSELQPAQPISEQPKPAKTETGKQEATETTTKKTAEWWQIIVVCFFVSLLSVTLTILGLSMFAQWAGTILGGMFALYLLASVLVSRNRLKGDTSEQALKTVLYMEIGASVLHGFTFYTLLPDTHNGLRITAAVLMAGFVAFLSYKTVLFVRTYNAEI